MTKKKQHVHQYHRIYDKGYAVGPLSIRQFVWGCALPDCTHFMPHNVSNQVPGKLSHCNNCMEVLVMDPETNMKLDKPLCDTCMNPDAVHVPENFDWERAEAKSTIAKNTGRLMEEITEAEIDRMVQLRRLNLK